MGSDGSIVCPITYNNTTYLPVRAISNVLGVGVDWDEESKTVLLGKNTTGIPVQPYNMVNAATKEIKMAGKTYFDAINFGLYNGAKDTSIMFNLEGKYKTLSFDIGHIDNGNTGNTTFSVTLDGVEYLKDVAISHDALPLHFDIDVTGVSQVKIDTHAITNMYNPAREFALVNTVASYQTVEELTGE